MRRNASLHGAFGRGAMVAWALMGAFGLGAAEAAGGVQNSAAATLQAASQLPTAQSRHALVIGNAHYVNVGPLRNPENDARDMCARLTQLGFQTDCVVDVASRRAFKQAVRDFTARLGKGAAGLFYYAGHGLQVDGENYLVPTEAELRTRADIDDEALNLKYLMAELDQAGNGFNIVILDACRNNPWSSSFRAVNRGLAATTDTPAGTIVIYATAANDLAQDGRGRNGVFTGSLLQHMTERGLSIEDMIKRVTIDVQSDSQTRTGMRQTPFVYSSFTGEFCFAGCEAPKPQGDANSQAELQAARERTAQLERELADAKARQAAQAPSGAPATTMREVPAAPAATPVPRQPVLPPTF